MNSYTKKISVIQLFIFKGMIPVSEIFGEHLHFVDQPSDENFFICCLKESVRKSTVVENIFSTLPWKKSFYDILRYIIKLPPVETAKILQKLRKSEIPTIATPIVIAQVGF